MENNAAGCLRISLPDSNNNDADIFIESTESSTRHSILYPPSDLGDNWTDESTDNSPETSKNLRIISMTTYKSVMWQFFKYDENKSQSTCQLCHKKYNGRYISNLQKHMKQKHREVFEESQANFTRSVPKKQESEDKLRQSSVTGHLTKTSTGLSIRKYDQCSSRYLSLRKKLSIFFAANSVPYSVSESPEFIEFITDLDCQFVPPGRRVVSRDIARLTAEIKTATATAITEAKQLTAVLDIWSRLALTQSYLGIKLQFFDLKAGEIQRALLALEKLEGAHTADNIFATFGHVLEKWKIPFSKINYFVTDNGSNMVKALRDCVDNYQIDDPDFTDFEDNESELFLAGDPNVEKSFIEELANFDECEVAHNAIFSLQKRISCMEHRLVCVLRRCVDNCTLLRPIISAAFSLIRAFTKSTKNTEALLSHPANGRHIKLLSLCHTRWIYIYYVFKRLIDLEQSVEAVVVENNLIDVAISPSQWKQIKQIVALLEPFAEVVTELEGEKYATLSHVIPTLYHLLDQLENEEGSAAIISIRRRIRCDLERTFSYILDPDAENFQPIYMVATFFEPKFLTGLSERQVKVAINEIQRQIRKENDSLSTFSPPLPSEDISQNQNVSIGPFSGFFKRRAPALISAHSITMKSFESQIHVYIEEANKMNLDLNLDEGKNLITGIEFWRKQKDGLLQSIAELALQVLAIPATSAGIERIFSLAGFVLEKRRFRLNSTSLENELFVKINRKFLNR